MAGIKNISSFTSRLSAFNVRLQNGFKETGRKINEELEEGAFRIQNLAKMFVPVDDGDMTEAIKVDIDRAPFRRNVYSVYVDETHVAVAGDSMVGEYLMFLHESRSYNLGPKSIAKAQRLGVEVGPKFLTRAYEQERARLINRVRQHLKGNYALKGN